LRKGSYHNEGYVDIVIKEKHFLISVEAKINGFSAVLGQASGNFVFFSYSYILYPRIPSKKSLLVLKNSGVGLIIPQGDSFQVYKKPKWNHHVWKKYRGNSNDVIKRNWKEDRIGRLVNASEIPDNYDDEKLHSLKPTYEWTNKKKIEIKKGEKTNLEVFLDIS